MWNFVVKGISYFLGPEFVESFCDHTDFSVSNEKVVVDTVTPICMPKHISAIIDNDDKSTEGNLLDINNDKSKVIEINKLVATAKCNICGYEFNTWANGEKINKEGSSDLSNVKRVDFWRYPPYFM